DANGILNVSAKDKATGKEQSIIIKASSGLSDEEVERMVQDAEAHADEDRKITELVTARNSAEGMINATEKSVEELGDKVDADEKGSIDSAIKALKEAIKGDDKDDIETKTTALTELSGKLAEKVYAEQAAAAGGEAPAGAEEAPKADDDALDAEFEEVKKD
ncbi:MAG: Hsp70 family protein, partial [Methylococcales bacterium]|nr:Hsp70 family protein [Methylococcales bacterium]